MKIFKMIIIFMLCFLLVGCGESKSDQVKEAYFDKGGEYALYKIEQLYGDIEKRNTKELNEVIELCDWVIQKECLKSGRVYDEDEYWFTE